MSLASGDLTTLATAKAYFSAPSDQIVQRLISAISRSILGNLGRPFILPKIYREYFDGSGNRSLVLPNWPVLSISSLAIDGTPWLQSGVVSSPFSNSIGWSYQPWNGFPPGEPAVLELNGGLTFWPGTRSTAISYLAGYMVSNEVAVIPVTPFRVTPLQPWGIWATDAGVAYSNGTLLTPISSGIPSVGQYIPPTPDAATPILYYTFSVADTGRSILLSYGFVPSDLEQVALEVIMERSAYRTRPGVRSKSLASQESVSYDNTSAYSAFATSVLESYRSVIPPAMGSFL